MSTLKLIYNFIITHKCIITIVTWSFIMLHSSLNSLHPDTGLSITELVTKYGYPIECHEIQTEDGYYLTTHRIPFGIKSPRTNRTKPPILLVHSLLITSIGFVNQGPNNSLGFLLADDGYDVWMGNQRGNSINQKHFYVDPNKNPETFYNFTLHEIGVYDMPATIDYVLNVTKQEQMYYLGHSQGSTIFFIMCSELPEYNKKIKLMIGLGPAVYLQHMKNPILRHVPRFLPKIEYMLKKFGINQILPHSKLISFFGNTFCNDGFIFQETCTIFLFLFSGFDYGQLDKNFIPVITSSTPAGASVKQVLHFFQFVASGIFRQYDYGLDGNLLKYNQTTPPGYNLQNVIAPIILHSAPNDWLVDPLDVERLAKVLPNLLESKSVPFGSFNHMDFIWSKDIVELVNDEIIKQLKSIN